MTQPCPQYAAQLSAHVDGELAAPEAQALELHLQRCSACRTCLEQQEALILALEECGPAPATTVWPAVRAQLQQRRASSSNSLLWLAVMAAGLVALRLLDLLVLGGDSLWLRLLPLVVAVGGFWLAAGNPLRLANDAQLQGDSAPRSQPGGVS